MVYYAWTATEGEMKVQEAILKAVKAQLRWIPAAEILEISTRTMR